jgi:hypothetical protein
VKYQGGTDFAAGLKAILNVMTAAEQEFKTYKYPPLLQISTLFFFLLAAFYPLIWFSFISFI